MTTSIDYHDDPGILKEFVQRMIPEQAADDDQCRSSEPFHGPVNLFT